MKKLLAVLLEVITVGWVFVACSKADDKKETTTKSESTSFTVQNPTDKAKIKDKDAIDFIKNAYTPQELGLDKVKEKYSFMISSNGEKIDKKEYVKVAANVMKKNSEKNADGKETYSLTPVGEYYISFDGQDVLMKDLKSGEYKNLENRYNDYKSKSETTTKAK